jgi:hypothetical protein
MAVNPLPTLPVASLSGSTRQWVAQRSLLLTGGAASQHFLLICFRGGRSCFKILKMV